MIKSMTGYGYVTEEWDNISLRVEAKSLNSKQQDANIKLPRIFSDKEVELRNYLFQKLERGKLYLSVDYQEKTPENPRITVNRRLLKQYYEELKASAREVGAEPSNLFELALSMPDVQQQAWQDDNYDELWKAVFNVIEKAVTECDAFRREEGKKLEEEFARYLELMRSEIKTVQERDPERIANIREKLQQAFKEWQNKNQVDQNRFEQELIFYIEKLDIQEEISRLNSHFEYFEDTMQSEEPKGKKLGFIVQEMNREINTIGSKANDAVMQKAVVNMKEELDKIKEQVQNIL